MAKYSSPKKLCTIFGLCVGIAGFVANISAQAQVKPTHELKVGARNSTIRNIGSIQADSALIFPKRDAGKDTAKSKALRKKGAFFLDSTTFVTWFFDGKHFRRATDSSIYNSDGKILQSRVVDIDGAKKAKLQFKNGAVHIDTLLLKKSKIKGTSRDSFLVRFQDTVKYIPFDSLRTIYNKDDSIKKPRLVTLQSSDKKSQTLHFAQGQIKIDSLLLPHLKIAEKDDSVLTIFKDSVRKRNIAEIIKSGKNIYTTDDSIKSARKVTLRGKNNAKSSVYFKDGQFSLDTLLIRKKNRGTSTDSFLVRFKDTVRYIPFDSLRTIYNKDDSIRHTGKSGKRIITLNNKKLIFRNTQKNSSVDSGRVGILQDNPLYTLDIATASFMKGSGNSNSNGDSIAVRISHNVEENKLGYGLLLSESSNKATGKSAIAFEGKGKNKKNNKDEDIQFKKAAIWAQNGKDFKRPLLGISTADSNRRLQERMYINHAGNMLIGKGNTDDIPARLMVNNSTWIRDVREIYTSDKKNYNPNDVGILVNMGGTTGTFKYGLVMREAAYNSNSKIGIGFYNGGYSTQPRGMASRIWSTTGTGANRPLFGIDVSTGLGNGRVANLYTRMVVNQNGYVGIGTTNPQDMLHIARDAQKNYIRVEAGATGMENNTTTENQQSQLQDRSASNGDVKYAGLWLTEKGNTWGWKIQNNPNTDMLEFAHTKSSNNAQVDYTPMVMSADGKVGIGTGILASQKPPYTLDVQTNSFFRSPTGNNSNSDTIAVRISHNVQDNRLSYALLLRENSNKATGRSAIGFEGGGIQATSSSSGSSSGNTSPQTPNVIFKKAAIWTQVGKNLRYPKFGISVANEHRALRTRMVINDSGFVGIGQEFPQQVLHIARQGYSNYIIVEGGHTSEAKYSGLWLTEQGNTYGWQIRNNPNTDMLEISHTNGGSNNLVGSNDNPYNRGQFSNDKIPVVISSNGNVGINTGAETNNKPTANLQVKGSVKLYDGPINIYGLPTINANANRDNNSHSTLQVNRNGYLVNEDSILVIKNTQVMKARADHAVNFYTRDDSIHNQNRTVSMKGHSIIFDNNQDHGMVIFKNSAGDNLVKIESNETSSKKGGLWMTGTLGTNQSGKYKEGFKMVNNPQNHQLEFYTTSQDVNGSSNTHNSNSQQILLPGNNKSVDNKVVAIHKNGTVQICGTGQTANFNEQDNDRTNKEYNFPTLKFQRNNAEDYWFIRFEDKDKTQQQNVSNGHRQNGLYFGVNKKTFLTTGKSDGKPEVRVDYRNRLGITNDVVIIGPTETNTYTIYDVDLSVKDKFKNQNKVLWNNSTRDIQRQGGNITPALFVNGAAQASEFIVSSDSALKREVSNIENALPKVLQLRPVSYYWKDTSEGSGFSRRLQIGFIAQEVQQVFPNLVQYVWSKRSEPTLGINYIGILPSVVGAVQELHARLQKVENEKATLKQKLAEQQQKLATEIQVRQNLEKREQDLENRVQALEKLLLKQSAASTENLSNFENIAVQQSLQE